MNAIEIKNLNKNYPGFSLGEINLTLPSGCIMGLSGENGAGKTTLIKLIMNAIIKDQGTIKILGTDNTSSEFLHTREDIGIILDEAYFPELLDARNINTIMSKIYTNWSSETYFSYLEKFSLPLNKAFKTFSKGMKMKLNIAVALSHEAKLLIMDEVTAGLDPLAREEILMIFNDFTRDENHSILISSHIISDLEKLCDYISFLHEGKLVICEEKDRLMEEYGLIRAGDEQLADIPPEAIAGMQKREFCTDLLVKNELVSSAFPREHVTLEEIIIFLVKGVER